MLIDVDRFAEVNLIAIRLLESPVTGAAFNQGNRRRFLLAQEVLALVSLRAAKVGQNPADGDATVARLFRLED